MEKEAGGLGRTALYLRLSRDDEKEGESLSIENQRTILQKYVQEKGGTVVDEYVDDGWSGTNFERPAVKRLLDDAKEGRIDTVIVKDLSRFGRNYIQVGQYIDYIFPACGIRFIALSDNVDTAERSSAGMDMMPIVNVFNEWHAANTSKKIRAVLEANWRKGKCTNWAYPYGYRAGDDENRTAVIDEEAADVVRKVYDLRLQGHSARSIAKKLTEEGISNPAAHYTRLDGKKSERRGSPYWSPKTVSDILKDPIYIGILTQHRTVRFSYKNHKIVQVPESERIIKENAHEPIVARGVWEAVQTINRSLSHGRTDKANGIHPFSGLLICADCGKKLKGKRAGSERIYLYSCRTYTDLGKKYCTSHLIGERRLEQIVLQDIRALLGRAKFDEERTKERFLKETAKRIAEIRQSEEKELRMLRDRRSELDRLIAAAFERTVLQKLPERVCQILCEKYQAEKNSAEHRIAELETRRREPADADAERYLDECKRCVRCEKLTREMCLQLIECIVIGGEEKGERKIDIYYKFCPKLPR